MIFIPYMFTKSPTEVINAASIAVRFRPQPPPSQVVAAGPSRTGIVSGGRDLFRAQRSNRIHIRCAARGKKTREQRGSGEHET